MPQSTPASVVSTPRQRRIVVCPQEFKGSLTAAEAADAIAAGVRRVLPDADLIVRPIADGGPGTMAIIAATRPSTLIEVEVADAYGRPVTATYALIDEPDGETTAVIESASAVALARTDPNDRAPLRSTSRGVGELIRHAASHGAQSVILGVGGTASSDGGAGAARALGLRLLDMSGHNLPDEALQLIRLVSIDDDVSAAVRHVHIRIAVDVRNPLTGEAGATAVFGAQKGLPDWQTPALDAAIAHWASIVRQQLHREIDGVEGTGAGGGIPAGIIAALLHVTIESGAALVAEATGLSQAIADADLVITGEGALDDQTAFGKAVAHVVALAEEHRVPCVAVAGTIEALPRGVADAEPLARTPSEIEAAIEQAADAVADAAERLMRRWETS